MKNSLELDVSLLDQPLHLVLTLLNRGHFLNNDVISRDGEIVVVMLYRHAPEH